MKLQYLPLLGVVLLMNACMWGVPKAQSPGVTQDTLAYTYKAINEKTTDCKGQTDSGCMIVNIKYPFFPGQQNLNDSISQKITGLLQIDDVSQSIDLRAYTQSFIKGYQKEKKQYPTTGHYKLNTKVKLVRQDSSLVTLEIDGYAFQSGARGYTGISFINWNAKINKPVYLSDILENDFQTKLTEIADSIFRKSENLSDTASLKPNYFFKNGVFSLNNNYLITPLGIRFLYNEYEIKPYAAGQTNLLIPYAKIKSLLLPHTVISQHLK
jgi:hypothetical protein